MAGGGGDSYRHRLILILAVAIWLTASEVTAQRYPVTCSSGGCFVHVRPRFGRGFQHPFFPGRNNRYCLRGGGCLGFSRNRFGGGFRGGGFRGGGFPGGGFRGGGFRGGGFRGGGFPGGGFRGGGFPGGGFRGGGFRGGGFRGGGFPGGGFRGGGFRGQSLCIRGGCFTFLPRGRRFFPRRPQVVCAGSSGCFIFFPANRGIRNFNPRFPGPFLAGPVFHYWCRRFFPLFPC